MIERYIEIAQKRKKIGTEIVENVKAKRKRKTNNQ